VKVQVVPTLTQKILSSVFISYCSSLPKSNQINIKCMAVQLQQVLELIGFPTVTIDDTLSSTTISELQLTSHTIALILCNSAYVDTVSKTPGMRDAIAAFGRSKKDSLHTLLCEGGFPDTAFKVIDKSFLVRSFQSVVTVLPADPLVSVLCFVDVFALLSGSAGLGILPDLMDLKLDINSTARNLYHKAENALQKSVQQVTIDYQLKVVLLTQHHKNNLISHLSSEKPSVDVKQIIQELVENPQSKTSLMLCQTILETELMSLVIEQELCNQAWRCVSIDCSNYPGIPLIFFFLFLFFFSFSFLFLFLFLFLFFSFFFFFFCLTLFSFKETLLLNVCWQSCTKLKSILKIFCL
jgi:hypothetical protein